MGDLTRAISLSGGIVNMETGEFPFVLASETLEASDGHVLGVRGAQMPKSVPMLFAHKDSEVMIPSLGSVHSMRVEKRGDLFAMPATGKFNMQGDGPLADIRRDMAQLTNNGDLPSASARWTGDAVARSSLPKTHEFHATRGLFFEKPLIKEGSILALGADPEALNGRADNAKDETQKLFWRVLASTPEDQDGMRDLAPAFAAYADAMEGMRKAGCSPEDFARISGIDSDEPVFFYELGGVRVALPATIYQQITRNDRELLRYMIDEQSLQSEDETRSVVVTQESLQSEVESGTEVNTPEPKRVTMAERIERSQHLFDDAARRGIEAAVLAKTGRRSV